MLRDDGEIETEFMTISLWPSIEAMGTAPGVEPRAVHHLECDPEFLIEVPSRAQILRLLESRSRQAALAGRARLTNSQDAVGRD